MSGSTVAARSAGQQAEGGHVTWPVPRTDLIEQALEKPGDGQRAAESKREANRDEPHAFSRDDRGRPEWEVASGWSFRLEQHDRIGGCGAAGGRITGAYRNREHGY
jgi:hypothetical protein